MLAESLDNSDENKDNSGGDKNNYNSAAATMAYINEDILLPDKTSIFSLLTNEINFFRPKYANTDVAAMKFRMNLFFTV